MERAMREYERAMQEYEIQQRDLEKAASREGDLCYAAASPVTPFEWYGVSPELPDRSTEKVIRQELRERDGLVQPTATTYIIEISSKQCISTERSRAKKWRRNTCTWSKGWSRGCWITDGTFKLVF